jgi:hypothetical protein
MLVSNRMCSREAPLAPEACIGDRWFLMSARRRPVIGAVIDVGRAAKVLV